jgi:hypothetical protein
MSTRMTLQLNAFLGLASTVAASAIISLVLTRPEAVASAVAQREYGAVALAMAAEFGGWLDAVLRFLM